jgi:hypothetical protein
MEWLRPNQATVKSKLNRILTNIFFPHGTLAPSGTGSPHWWNFIITFRHITDCSGRALRRNIYLTTHIHDPRGIRTRSPRKTVAADPRLKTIWPLLSAYQTQRWTYWIQEPSYKEHKWENSSEIRIRREVRHEYPSHTTGTIHNLSLIYWRIQTYTLLLRQINW